MVFADCDTLGKDHNLITARSPEILFIFSLVPSYSRVTPRACTQLFMEVSFERPYELLPDRNQSTNTPCKLRYGPVFSLFD